MADYAIYHDITPYGVELAQSDPGFYNRLSSEMDTKVRRQIEDRLRKDEQFFTNVASLFSGKLYPEIYVKKSLALCDTCGEQGIEIQAWVDGQPMSTVSNRFYCPSCGQ